MNEKYSLNDQTLKFILEFEKDIPFGTQFENKKLVEMFRKSSFYRSEFNTYIEKAVSKAIWYAVKRSESWSMGRGVYIKGSLLDSNSIVVTTGHISNSDSFVVTEEYIQDVNSAVVTNAYIPNKNRSVYIKFLSGNLYNVLMLKNQILDEVLKGYHLSAKGIGDDLYFLTESYYRQLGIFKGKHSMSDFITPIAKEILSTGKISKRIMYEHMVPKNLYIGEIVQATKLGVLREERIYEILSQYYYVCTVSVEEDKLLPSIKMDDDWDGRNPFHRYEKAGITFIKNVERYS